MRPLLVFRDTLLRVLFSPVFSVRFSPDGQYLAVGCDGRVWICNAHTGRQAWCVPDFDLSLSHSLMSAIAYLL